MRWLSIAVWGRVEVELEVELEGDGEVEGEDVEEIGGFTGGLVLVLC